MSNRTAYIIGLGLIVFLVGDFIYSHQYRKYVVNNGEKTVGTIINIIDNDVVCEYVVDKHSFRYRRSAENFNGLKVGEHYNVAYDPDNPTKAYALYYEPVILPTEEKYYLITKPLSVEHENEHLDIEFSYKADNVIYRRTQKSSPGTKLNMNKKYFVKYNQRNPKIAYIFPGEPTE